MDAKRDTSARPHRPGATLRLHVPPDPRYAKYVRARVAGFASAYALPDPDVRDFLTAVGEALANAIEHARSAGDIEVSCWMLGGDHLIATVTDSGVGFHPNAPLAADPALPQPLAERGRGLPIMRRCTDTFAVRSEPGKGTTVVLGLHVRPRDTGNVAHTGTTG